MFSSWSDSLCWVGFSLSMSLIFFLLGQECYIGIGCKIKTELENEIRVKKKHWKEKEASFVLNNFCVFSLLLTLLLISLYNCIAPWWHRNINFFSFLIWRLKIERDAKKKWIEKLNIFFQVLDIEIDVLKMARNLIMKPSKFVYFFYKWKCEKIPFIFHFFYYSKQTTKRLWESRIWIFYKMMISERFVDCDSVFPSIVVIIKHHHIMNVVKKFFNFLTRRMSFVCTLTHQIVTFLFNLRLPTIKCTASLLLYTT